MINNQEVQALQQLIASSEDEVHYVRLYRIYYRPLFKFALSFVRTRQTAEEIVSDVFMQIWTQRAQLDTIEHLTVYLYTCIRNHSLNYLRRHQKQQTEGLEEIANELVCSAEHPDQLMITSQLIIKIDKAVQQLPRQCRLIFILIREDGLKYREVAEVLGISVKTVETQIGIAMKKISMAIQSGTSNTFTYPPSKSSLQHN